MEHDRHVEELPDIYRRLKRDGLSDEEIEEELEEAFGNRAFDIGEELVLTDEEREEFYDEMRAQGWGFLIDSNRDTNI